MPWVAMGQCLKLRIRRDFSCQHPRRRLDRLLDDRDLAPAEFPVMHLKI
jgi:hypothetical protein